MMIKQRISGWIFTLGMALTILLGFSSCRDDLNIGYGPNDLGEKIYGKISIPIGSINPVTVTRSVDFSQDALVKIDSYWIGIFDSKTGECLGVSYNSEPRKDDGTRFTLRSNSAPFTVENIDIWYYDKNPAVYIAGVINFNDVKAKNVGEAEVSPLEDLLAGVKTFNEFRNIAIDTESADRANRNRGSDESCPLMMGFYTTSTSTVHTTVKPDGTLSQDDSKIRIVRNSSNYSEVNLPEGSIKLQRLLAEMNYNVIAGEGVTIHNVEFMVVNNPLEVYLAEHQTDQNGGTTNDKETYLANTPNSADYTDAFQTTGYRPATKVENGFKFSYQAYENKHWGRKWSFPEGYDQTSLAIREKRYEDKNSPTGKSDVFRTLCQYQENPLNNKASYIVMKTELSFINYETLYQFGYSDYEIEKMASDHAVIYYTIHEGATSRPDGTVNSAESRGYDFQRVRNTQYNYNITINGVEDLIIQAEQKEGFYHNDGISGDAWHTEIYEFAPSIPSDYRKLVLTFPNPEELDIMTWRLYYKSPEGEVNYGNWKKDPNAPSSFPEWIPLQETVLNNLDVPEPHASEALVMVNGTQVPFKELNSKSHPEWSYPLSLEILLNPITQFEYDKAEQYRRGLYFCLTDVRSDGDGCNENLRVVGFEQSAVDLRRDQTFSCSPYYLDYIPNGSNDYTYSYNTWYTGYTYFYTPYYTRPTSSSYWDYSYNERYWSGSKETGAYINWGFSPNQITDYIVRIYSENGNILELEKTVDINSRTYNGSYWKYLCVIDSDEVKNLSTGYHTVTITSKGDPSIFKPEGVTVTYEHSLLITEKCLWTFTDPLSSSTSLTAATYFNQHLIDNSAYFNLNYDGLWIVGGRSFKGSNSYISTGRTSWPYYADTQYAYDDRYAGAYFMFTVNKPGTVKIRAGYPTNSSASRTLYLYKGEYVFGDNDDHMSWSDLSRPNNGYLKPVEVDSVEFSNPNTNEYILHVSDITEVTDLLIGGKENIYIYSIEFIPD